MAWAATYPMKKEITREKMNHWVSGFPMLGTPDRITLSTATGAR